MTKMVTFIGAGLFAASVALAGPALADSGSPTSSTGTSELSNSISFTSPSSASDFANNLQSQLSSVPWCGSCGFWVTGAQSPSV